MKRAFPFHSNAVWPPLAMLIPFAFIYALLAACLWTIASGARQTGVGIENMEEFRNIRAVLLGGVAGLFAAYRIIRFHPKCNQAYAAWLKMSPWTADKPLPLGPVHLVWQDVAVIGIFSLIAWGHAGVDPALPVAVFVGIYLMGMTLVLALLRQWPASVALGFLWPALILPNLTQPVRIGLFVAIVAVVWYGHWKSLKTFPWDIDASKPIRRGSILQIEIQMQPVTAVSAPANVGWPFTVLGPKIRGYSISAKTAFWLSGLFGWWSYCAMELGEADSFPEIMLLLTLPLALFRFGIYCSGIAPSFNLWGRIASGRLILPGYDKVHLTSLAALLVSIVGALLIRHSGTWYLAAESIGIAIIWFVMFSGGPTRKNWILTGQHRFRVTAQPSNKRLMQQV